MFELRDKTKCPEPQMEIVRTAREPFFRLFCRLGWTCYCEICDHYARKFLPFRKRANACCPHCRSLERHRLLWRLLRTRTNLFSPLPKRVLHFAPEPCIQKRLVTCEQLCYLPADLAPKANVQLMDITRIALPDRSIDAVLCNHVLEHVPNDRQAISEIYRVLRPHGWAVITVPISKAKTFEDPSATTPAMRKKLFGQENHVRQYGLDIAYRLRDAGFSVEILHREDLVSAREWHGLGLDNRNEIFFCARN